MLMGARFLFTFAVQMQAVVLGWKMYDLTHDPLSLGLIGLSEAIPAVSLALYAGYVVDRSKPLVIYRLVLAGSFVSGLVLLFSQLSQVGLGLATQVYFLYLASFITGIARGFAQPVIFATVPRIVPREDLQKASAWMSSALQIARIAGPAVGGLVFGWFGSVAAALLVCVALVLAFVCVVLVRSNPGPVKAHTPRLSLGEELLSGLRFVFGHSILLPALSLDMVSVFFGGVTALLPIFADEILHIGPKGLGLLRAAPAIGAAFMSFKLTRMNIRAQAGTWLFSSIAGFGICILIFGLSQNFYLSLLALGLSGVFDSVSMIIRSSAVQLISPDHLRGRISSVNSIFIASSNEIGEFESGVAARFLGTVPAVLFGGSICLITVFLVALFSPSLRKLDLDQV